MEGTIARRAAAETVGTAFLLAAVVGSGIAGERLSGGNAGQALLANALATAAALATLILIFGPISGAHFNPAVTLAFAMRGDFPWRAVPAYVAAQIVGALAGVAAAHAMFDLPIIELSTRVRAGPPQMFSELLATFGLVLTVLACARHRAETVPFAVAAYIGAAYWFTSSTSFANPTATLARSLTDTFSGIRPADAPPFIAAQLCGAALAALFFAWLTKRGRA